MACSITSPLDCTPSDVVSNVVGDAASSAWDSVCQSFADAAVTMLKGFAEAFASFPNVDPTSGGIRSVYGLSLGIAGVVAALLFLLQIARSVMTHDGAGLAQGFVGIGKAAIAFLTTLTVASAGLLAADGLTVFIINQTFGSAQGLTDKLTTLFELDTIDSGSLLLILALVGIALVAVLWFELLLRNAAVAVLIATSPIPAAGMVSEWSKQWWSNTVSATTRLIVLKPVIALVFGVGFGVIGNEGKSLGSLLAGMLILGLAALAWPAIARFFTFAAAHSGGPSGLGAVLGFAAGKASGGGGEAPVGVKPDQFGQHAEARTMASYEARADAAAGAGASSGAAGSALGGAGTAGGTGGGAAAGGAAVGGPVGAGSVMAVAKGAERAQRVANSMVGRMEQTAGHAGLSGASPYAHPAGYARNVPSVAGPGGSDHAAVVGGQHPSSQTIGGPAERSASAPPAEPTSSVPAPAPDTPPQTRSGPEAFSPPEASNPAPAEPISTTPPSRSSSPLVAPLPGTEAPPIPQQRAVSPIEHVRPQQSSPVEYEKGNPS